MADDRSKEIDQSRNEVRERLADVLEGSAPEQLLDFIAEDGESRDLVYDAERATDLVQDCAADYTFDASKIEAGLAAALEKARKDAEEAGEPAKDEAPEADEDDQDETGAPSGDERVESQSEARAEPRRSRQQSGRSSRPEKRNTKETPSRAPLMAWTSRLGARGKALLAAAGVLALVAALLAAVKGRRHDEIAADGEGWSGRVGHVSRGFGHAGLDRCSPEGTACTNVGEGDDVPAGSVLRTDGQSRAMIELGDGSRVLLDRATELELSSDESRRARLRRGGVVADVADGETTAIFEVPLGKVESGASKFSLRVYDEAVVADVSRGRVRLTDEEDRSVTAYAGESGRLYRDRPPTASAIATLGDSIASTESDFSGVEKEDTENAPGLGELRAKKPGEQNERRGAVRLASHSVRVRIAGSIARTEIDETFTNETDETLEGIYRFPMPPNAQIERLALEVDGKLEEGAFVDRERAAAIWRGAIVNSAKKPVYPREEIVWVPGPWRDPALLEWQRGGRFELRIFPIPKKGSRRVLLAYTQVIAPSAGLRRYVYPLPHDPGGSTKVARFSVDLQVRGHDQDFGTRVSGYPLEERKSQGFTELTFTANDFVPAGDLTVDYALEDREAEVTAWAYQPGPDEGSSKGNSDSTVSSGSSPYVAIAFRPKLPRWSEDVRRSFAIVVDSSRSMIGERYRRATRLAEGIVREMDRLDRVTVLACDTTCQEIAGGLAAPSSEHAGDVMKFLQGITPEGGSDISAAIRFAREAAQSRGGGAVRVVYIGDGTPTVGPVQPAFLRREIEQIMPADVGTVTTVALGSDADVPALETIAQAGGGALVAYTPGQRAMESAYAVLAATYGNALRDADVELPAGLVDTAPGRLPALVAGSETFVVARMTRPVVEGTVKLRGKLAGKVFEQSYPLKVEATTSKGNAFVPRLYAAAKIADLEKEPDAASRQRAVALSQQFNVASRYTSLLVLESTAMFTAFGLDREHGVASWTGEDEATSTDSEGELAYAADTEDEFASRASGGAGRAGVGAAKVASSRSTAARAERSAPAPKKKSYSMSMDAPAGAAEPAPAPSPPAAAAPSTGRVMEMARDDRGDFVLNGAPADPLVFQRQRWVPMRKIWERVGYINAPGGVPKSATTDAILQAERAAQDETNRDAVKKLYALYMLAGDLDKASDVAERWSEKDPLDADALTARADIAAAHGERDLAIRILGSVVDVRPGDHKAQWRLARLHRWAGRATMGCRHSVAVSQIRPTDGKLLAEAVRCARDVGQSSLADDLLRASDEATRRAADKSLADPATDPNELKGDFRVEATWDAGQDLDLSLLHPEGHRVSWLGAPTRSVITARDVLSTSREALALKGAESGEYVVEIGRGDGGNGVVRGTVEVTAGKTKRQIPFVLDGTRTRIALVNITMRPRLVPL